MGVLVVTRAPGFVGRFQRLEVYVDDSAYDTLARGEEGRYRVTPGPHTLMVQTGWFSGSIRIHAGDDDVVHVRAIPPRTIFLALFGYVMFFRRKRMWRLEIVEVRRAGEPDVEPEDDASVR